MEAIPRSGGRRSSTTNHTWNDAKARADAAEQRKPGIVIRGSDYAQCGDSIGTRPPSYRAWTRRDFLRAKSLLSPPVVP